MKVKMLSAVFTSPEPIKVDDIVQLDDSRGAYWIAQGWAERVSDDLPARHEIVSENQWRTDTPPIGAVIECKWYHEEALRVCEVVQLPNDRPGRYLLYDQATGIHYDARSAEKWRVLNGHTHVIASSTPDV